MKLTSGWFSPHPANLLAEPHSHGLVQAVQWGRSRLTNKGVHMNSATGLFYWVDVIGDGSTIGFNVSPAQDFRSVAVCTGAKPIA
jgi:hypothetical protein